MERGLPQQIPVEGFQMSNVEDQPVTFADGPVV